MKQTTLLYLLGGAAVLGTGTAIYFAMRKPAAIGGDSTKSAGGNANANAAQTAEAKVLSNSLAPLASFAQWVAKNTPSDKGAEPPAGAPIPTQSQLETPAGQQDYFKDVMNWLNTLKVIKTTFEMIENLYTQLQHFISDTFAFELPGLNYLPISF